MREVRQLLAAAVACEHPASVIPYIVVQLFAGLRPTEAGKLRWERIGFDTGQIEVLAATYKTRETRFVELEPLLAEWLLPFRVKQGPITGVHFARTLREVRAVAGLSPWPKDVLRHCYGSYWLAVHKDRAHLAELMGNSLQVIKRHYRRAVSQPVAEEFWKLAPSLFEGEPGKIISVPATAWSSKEPDLTLGDSHMSEMEDQIEFLQRPDPEFPTLQFRFAKTIAKTPHAYVVRTRANEGEYVKLFGLITEHGVWEVWKKNGRRYQYYYRDGFKYWRMTNDVNQSQIINRAAVDAQ